MPRTAQPPPDGPAPDGAVLGDVVDSVATDPVGAVVGGPARVRRDLRPAPPPPDPPMVPLAIGGMAVWAAATLVMLPFYDSHRSWFWICVAGFLWGIPGLLTMLRREANRRRRSGAR